MSSAPQRQLGHVGPIRNPVGVSTTAVATRSTCTKRGRRNTPPTKDALCRARRPTPRRARPAVQHAGRRGSRNGIDGLASPNTNARGAAVHEGSGRDPGRTPLTQRLVGPPRGRRHRQTVPGTECQVWDRPVGAVDGVLVLVPQGSATGPRGACGRRRPSRMRVFAGPFSRRALVVDADVGTRVRGRRRRPCRPFPRR